jgi:hypothetical protein
MSALDYIVEAKVDCSYIDVNDTAFVQATTMIGGHDPVEEFLACGMYPLSSGFGFRDVAIRTTIVSKVETALPIFPVEAVSAGSANHFLAKVKSDADKFLGSYGPREYYVCMLAKLPNSGRLNRVFEQMGVPYAAAPVKVAPPKKIVKVIQPKAIPGPRGTSEVDLILAKSVGVSKNFCFSDMSSSSQSQRDEGRRVMKVVRECTSGVISFDNLGDSSPDVHEASSWGKVADAPLPPPLITSG